MKPKYLRVWFSPTQRLLCLAVAERLPLYCILPTPIVIHARLVFMAVTSAMSAELIAVSSVWTYDIYRIYTNPEATSTALVSKSHYAIVIFAYFIAGFSTILSYAGISMGYLYLIMGVLISSAVLPIALTVLWKRMNWYAAVFSPILGVILSVSSWLGKAKSEFGTLSISSTGS